MEEQERLTMELVKSLMDKSYTLVWVDYNDNLDNCRDTIQKCLEERSCESLWEKVDEWYGDAEWEAVREIVSKLKDECIRFHDFGEEEVDKFFQEHEDEIREEIYDRNDSDTLKELLKNTDDIPVRVEMLSNYDCINSNWLESQEGYRFASVALRPFHVILVILNYLSKGHGWIDCIHHRYTSFFILVCALLNYLMSYGLICSK